MSYTTSITLARSWFTNPLDLGFPVSCGTNRTTDRSDAFDGSIRQYAGGRRQAVITPTKMTTIPITLVGLSYDDWQRVIAWAENGTVVLFRSAAGEREWVTFFEVQMRTLLFTTMNDGRAFNVTTTLLAIDHDESV